MAEPLKLYINLARDGMRRQATEQAFAHCAHRPQRFAAVDWYALAPDDQQRFYRADLNETHYFRPLTAGECGCYVSHLEICRTLLASDAPWALVLEDDVEPEAHFDTTLDLVGSLPAAWDLIKLIGRRKDRIVNQHPVRAGLQLVQYRKVPNLASAYLISRAGASKLLATRIPFMRPIDVDMRWWWDNDLRIFGLMPYPLRLSQTSDLSSIGSRRGQRDWQSRLRKAAQTFDYNLKVLTRSSLQTTHWAAMTQSS